MPTAMKQVREALGDDAVILSSQTHKGKKGVTITAAVQPGDDEDAPAPSRVSSSEPLRFKIHELLRFHNVPEMFIAKIINADKSAWTGDVRHCLEKLMAAYFTFDPINMQQGNILMLVGPPGIGKTLTIARIASRLAMDKQPALIITTDNKRAGGVEQLQAFTTILNQPLKVAASRKALAEHLKSAERYEYVLIDTAGCNPYDTAELDELADFADQKGIDPVLALPAGGDSLEAIDHVEAFMALPIKRMLVTRADTARRFGGILAAAAAHNLSFCNVSSSSSIVDPLLPVDEALLAQLLLRYQLQT
jgi:flagellar biosynthesis protein FlhF